jgi:hypothetical protein
VSAAAVICVSVLFAAQVQAQTKQCLLADGFDYPVGKPDAKGYHKARGYSPNGHMGEDWNGNSGGDTDLNDPIYSTARGVVVVSEDVKVGWGNCIIVRHAYRDATGKIQMVDSQYAHLNARIAKVGDVVERGQKIGLMGGNHGMYPVHLHFEMRKNLHIGMNRGQFARDDSCYYSPSAFIASHRTLSADFTKVDVPTKGFTPYGVQMAASEKATPVSIGLGLSSRSFRIPVYKTEPSKTPTDTKAKDSVSRIRDEVQAGTKPGAKPSTKPSPSVTAPPEKTDFWMRLKSKFTNGKVVEPDKK